MAANKFIERLKGQQTTKSALEIENLAVKASFANMPAGTSDPFNVYSDSTGNSVAVLKGADNWKLNNGTLALATTLYSDGRDFTSTYTAAGNTAWVNASYTFSEAKIFTPSTKWVLKLCGHRLLSSAGHIINFTLIVKFNNDHIATRDFFVKENAFEFCEEFAIDFGESQQDTIKIASADKLTVQLLCNDPEASATIYNGMTTLTALQRRVDSEAVASNEYTFQEISDTMSSLVADYIKKDGSVPMLAPLRFRTQLSTFRGAISAGMNGGVYFHDLDSNGNALPSFSGLTTDGLFPDSAGNMTLGSTTRQWKDAHIARVITSVINNGYDIAVPVTAQADTLALKSQVDDAANSGEQLYATGVWYAKMYAATTIPSSAEVEGRNYADFSQVDVDNNPIIVVYTYTNGAWVTTETITPPANHNGYMTITSKIWDISEQTGQQGGLVLWAHNQGTFTPYPRIVSFDGANITNSTISASTITNSSLSASTITNSSFSGTAALSGTPTAPTPTSSSSNTQIATKEYVDSMIAASGSGRNVGDIFFTSRNDNSLNGSVQCDGMIYNLADFTGTETIGQLLAAGKVPYVSLADYATALASDGVVGVFGWDGISATTFRVPMLEDIFIEAGTVAQLGDFIEAGVPNITGTIQVERGSNNDTATGAFYITNTNTTSDRSSAYSTQKLAGFDASRSSAVYGNSNTVQPNAIKYRPMVQLAISATDEAVMTCTAVTAQVASNTAAINSADYVVESQAPSAQNDYTWYRKYKSGWVEQGGISNLGTHLQAVSLPVTMSDTNYTIELTGGSVASGGVVNVIVAGYLNQTTSGFDTYANIVNNNSQTAQSTGARRWFVAGIAA